MILSAEAYANMETVKDLVKFHLDQKITTDMYRAFERSRHITILKIVARWYNPARRNVTWYYTTHRRWQMAEMIAPLTDHFGMGFMGDELRDRIHRIFDDIWDYHWQYIKLAPILDKL